MTELRVVNLVVWALVFARMLPAVRRVLFGTLQSDDPNKLVFASFAAIVAGFNLRWLLIPESETMHAALYAFSIALAAMVFALARTSPPTKEKCNG